MFKRTKIHQLIALTTLAATMPLAALAQAKDPVRLALITSKSGGFATMGADVANGIRFAVEEANARGGVDGRRVIVSEGDDESTPDAGRRAAEKLSREGHNLIIGPISSGISLTISQNLSRWDAALIGTISKADRLTGDSCNTRFIRTNHSDAMDMAMVNDWLKGVPGNNFAIMAADYLWGQDSAKAFESVKARDGIINVALETRRLQLAIDTVINSPSARAEGFGQINAPRMTLMASQVSDAFNTKTRVKSEDIWNGSFLPTAKELDILPKAKK
jgi:branched-chain amino acid transport system substrate-binding protein